METVFLAVSVGLAAGLTPGPLLTLVVASSLERGIAAGLRVALAPLFTDLPIVVIVIWALGNAPPWMLSVLALIGGIVLIVLGVRTFLGATMSAHAARADTLSVSAASEGKDGDEDPCPDASPGDGGTASRHAGRRDLLRGAVVNVLNPNPWIAWSTVLGPQVVALWGRGRPLAVLFVVFFYACLVGTMIVIALGVSKGRHRIGDGGHRWALRICAALLVGFGGLLIARGM